MAKKSKKVQDEVENLEVKSQGDIALKALNKEFDVEKMLEHEEIEKEKEEDEILERQLKEEQKKKDCIMKAIKEREEENQLNLVAKGKAEEVTNLRNAAQKQIKIRREYLRKRLENLRKKAIQRSQVKKQQIMNIRMEVASKLTTAYKKGNNNVCLEAITSDAEWKSYCHATFTNNYNVMEICLRETDKCHYCCEQEFGNIYMDERMECFEKVCPTKNDAKEDNGRWVFNSEPKNKNDVNRPKNLSDGLAGA